MIKEQAKEGKRNIMPGETSKRVALVTLGCKVNQYESAGMADRLKQLGHTLVDFEAGADICIVNTCTVTARTDFQSRQLIRRAARRNPEAPVIVTGCYAQVAADLIRTLPNVRIVAGNAEKELIPGLVGTLHGGPVDVFVGDIEKIRHFSGLSPDRFPGKTRAFLKIQDGCNARCAYCIVPKARGPSRSMPEDSVLERVSALSAEGYREIVLTGIHLGAWGQDLSPAVDLPSLISRIGRAMPTGRLRISSVEPLEVTAELMACFRDSPVLCPHLHVPLQSGDDRILASMGRQYTGSFFRTLVDRLVAENPSLAIGVDVMAGYPGEGTREFENTLSLLKDLPLAYLHVFPYSDRPGTEASKMEEKVDDTEKKKRAALLRNLGLAKREAFSKKFVGTRQVVLVEEGRDRKTGRMKGLTGNYIPVLLQDTGKEWINCFVAVDIESADAGTAIGRVRHE
jgi:threonylcarbamoyladenosine tRNA methylthiotransferase MtaB